MPTNFYFNNFPQHQLTSEQMLVEDLVIEAMQIHGMDVYYIPRTSRDVVDTLYGEDTLKQFRTAHPIEMYLENVTGMDGEGDFISKFGLEIKDEITLLVSRRRFLSSVPELGRAREGDLVYVPLTQNFFEITFVEHEDNQAMFYTLGRGRGGNVYVYALKLKQFVFSEEIISTGIAEVDAQAFESYKRTRLPLANSVTFSASTGTFQKGELVWQGDSYANLTSQAIVYHYEPHTELTVIQVQGTLSSRPIYGNTSNAIRSVILVDDSTQVDDNVFEDLNDNIVIQTESDGILDFTEHNPFGEA